ncbi:MAG: aspartate kinase [Holophagales bacterium]|nr:MAG: aspartate kinase [Holophagales bacterium]
MRPCVLKFGGTSLATPERIRAVVAILREAAAERPVVAVASALAGVTDGLLVIAERARRCDKAARRDLASLAERHRAALVALAPGDRAASRAVERELGELAAALEGVTLLRELPAGVRDRLASAGERLSVALLAAALRAAGLSASAFDAADLVATDATFGEAEVDLERTRRSVDGRLVPRLGREIPVVPGFYGAAADGRVRLLGRGASDLTATILGACLQAERVEIWTDVDGVLSADPRLVPEAFTLARLTPALAGELAHFGAKVLHPRAVWPAALAGVPIVVANTGHPGRGRSEIVSAADDRAVRAIATRAGVALLRIAAGARSLGELATSALSVLVAARLPVLLVQQAGSGAELLVAVDGTAGEPGRAVLAGMGLSSEVEERLALVAIVGRELAAPARQLLSSAGVSPRLWSEHGTRGAVAAVAAEALAATARRLHAELVVPGAPDRKAA